MTLAEILLAGKLKLDSARGVGSYRVDEVIVEDGLWQPGHSSESLSPGVDK